MASAPRRGDNDMKRYPVAWQYRVTRLLKPRALNSVYHLLAEQLLCASIGYPRSGLAPGDYA